MSIGIRATLLIIAGALLAATLVVASVDQLSFAYRSPEAHVILETAASLIALLIAFILYGRLRENGLVGELVLFTALTLLALANLTRAVAPSFDGTNPRVVWIPLAAQLLGAVAFAAAPLITPRRLRSPHRSLAYASAAVAVALVAIVVFGLAAGGLSTGIDPMPSPEDARAPTISGTAGLLTVQTISIVLFAVGAVGFARRAQDSGDELLAWLALAATFAVFARVNYLLFPSVFSDWVSTGDVLRLATYLALLVGALRQIATYRAAALRAAILDERKRIALDLHDRLAQDLAFITLQARRLAGNQEQAESLAAAAQDALLQSRAMIVNLRLGDASLTEAIANLATALTARYDIALDLDLEDGIDAADEERDELLNIVSEAISNASRHGDASEIRIGLRRTHGLGLMLEVADDGSGFDISAPTGQSDASLGIAGMNERVARLGGTFELESSPGAGAVVRVVLA